MFFTFLDGRGTQSLPQALGRRSRAGRIVYSQGMWRKRTSLWQEERQEQDGLCVLQPLLRPWCAVLTEPYRRRCCYRFFSSCSARPIPPRPMTSHP